MSDTLSQLPPPERTSQKIIAPLAGIGAFILLLASGFQLVAIPRVARGGWSAEFAFLFIFAFLFCFGMALLILFGKIRPISTKLVCAFFLALALFVRICLLDYVTGDYTYFLSTWVQFFRDNGGFLGLGSSIGDYNVPYLYFLSLISYSGLSDLLLIKVVSIFFDILAAMGIFLLTQHLIQSRETDGGDSLPFSIRRHAPIIAFFVILFLPTVYFNGAVWAQCDSIYSSFAIFSIYFALRERSVLSVLCIALSFSFKLQAIFLMPVFLLFVIVRKVKFWHLFLFPVFYIVTCLPALLMGRPFMDLITIYFNQTGTYSDWLTMNAPSIFSFLPYQVLEPALSFWRNTGILLAALLVFAVLLFGILRRKRLTDSALVTAAMLLVVGIPLLLPHMHERYFFLCEILSVAWALSRAGRYFLPAQLQVACLSGYHAYLARFHLYPLKYGAVLLGLALPILAYDFWLDTSETPADLPDSAWDELDDSKPPQVLEGPDPEPEQPQAPPPQ